MNILQMCFRLLSQSKIFILLVSYYCFTRYLPPSHWPLCIGNLSKILRYYNCKSLFKKCGKNVNVERKAAIGIGRAISIGDNSGLGINSIIEGPIIIGRDVMMGPNSIIYRSTHAFDRTDIPMNQQGITEKSLLEICDDVWIGRNVIILPGCRRIGKGSIIGAGAIVTKDVPDYSISAGNPAKVRKMRGSYLEIKQ